MPSITGNLIDLPNRRIYGATVEFSDTRITQITPTHQNHPTYLLPGFVDAHVHVESSMLPPSEFARLAAVHGTVATVSDPHEIANVLGVEGINYMIADGRRTPFKFCFGAPSCVPATAFETSGAHLDAAAIESLLARPDIGYLSEVMNFPGVINRDPTLLAMLAAARRHGKPIDGHAPALRGKHAREYFHAPIAPGAEGPAPSQAEGRDDPDRSIPTIQTDHECVTLDEALDKVALGVKILIREGSAARNFDALWPLLKSHPEHCMLCSDDKHPNDLEHGHINALVARAVAHGIDLFDALLAACVNPVRHYRLPVGLLRVGDPADFIEVQDLRTMKVLRTWISGQLVAENGQPLLPRLPAQRVNRFEARPRTPEELAVPRRGKTIRVIEVDDGQLVTRSTFQQLTPSPQLSSSPSTLAGDGGGAGSSNDPSPTSLPIGNRQSAIGNTLPPDPAHDLLKIAVADRYGKNNLAIAFIRGFGLRRGAIASSVAHDSHNIVAVGADDESLCHAINALIRAKGGLAVISPRAEPNSPERQLAGFAPVPPAPCPAYEQHLLPLPIAGLMSDLPAPEVAARYAHLDALAKSLGCPLAAPFMTLSFMALPVIPALKLTDRGLFDVNSFRPVDLFE